MPALFAPALDLAALVAVLTTMALLFLAYELSKAIGDVLNRSILGVHPFAGIASALEHSLTHWLKEALDASQDIARDLWHGLTWSWNQLLDGINAFSNATEDALHYLRHTVLPDVVNAALAPLRKELAQIKASGGDVARVVARDVARLDARVDRITRDAPHDIALYADHAIDVAVHGIDQELRAIRSTVDQAVDHALAQARLESGRALGELRNAENTAIHALGDAQTATAGELRGLLDSLNPSQIAGLVAAIPILSALVSTIATESGLDSADCRGKVKGICGTDPLDWGMLLGGIGLLAIDIDLEDIVNAGRELVSVLADGEEDSAFTE